MPPYILKSIKKLPKIHFNCYFDVPERSRVPPFVHERQVENRWNRVLRSCVSPLLILFRRMLLWNISLIQRYVSTLQFLLRTNSRQNVSNLTYRGRIGMSVNVQSGSIALVTSYDAFHDWSNFFNSDLYYLYWNHHLATNAWTLGEMNQEDSSNSFYCYCWCKVVSEVGIEKRATSLDNVH